MNIIADYANEATRRHVASQETIVSTSWKIEDAGCRAVAMDPPSRVHGRGIVTIHEWPVRRYFRNLLRPQRCFCGDTTR